MPSKLIVTGKAGKGPVDLFLHNLDTTKLLRTVAGKEGPKIATRKRGVIRNLATDHYQNAIQQVRRVLSLPGNAPESVNSPTPRPRTIPFHDVKGKSRRMITDHPWQGLTPGYAARKPKSLQFWHKSGRLIAAYSKLGMKKKAQVHQVAGGGMVDINKKRVQYRTIARVSVQRLAYPFSVLISDSFLNAYPGVVRPTGQRYPKGDVRNVVYPEYYGKGTLQSKGKVIAHGRPFIAQLSALLGKDLQEELRRFK